MKVLILGASGFIGKSVTEAFVRAGHITYGQTRSTTTAQEFARNEIVPVVCDPLDKDGLATWGKIAAQADIVIDCLKGQGAKAALSIFQNFKSASSRPKGSPRPTFIYTGGLWSNTRGDGGLESWTDERQPRSSYNEAVAWRQEIEDPILTDESINGIVIRGPILYGRSGSFVAAFIFDAAYEAAKSGKEFTTVGRNETRWQTIHQDDLGELYLRVAERAPICRGQIFLGSNLQAERLTDVLDAVVRVSGAKGYKLQVGDGGYDKPWASTLNARPSLGPALTGWQPKKLSLVDGMDLYWAAYVASKEGDKYQSKL